MSLFDRDVLPVLLGGIALAVGAFYLLVRWLVGVRPMLRRMKRLAPTRPIDAREGAVVRVVGTVRAGSETLRSPVREVPCVAWRATGWLRERDGARWKIGPIGETWRAVRFFVDTAEGAVEIDAEEAEPQLTVGERISTETLAEDAAIRARLAEGRGRIDLPDGPPRGDLSWAEAALAPGARVTVVGVARWSDDPTQRGDGYRGGGRRLVLEGGTRPVLFLASPGVQISDDPSLTQSG